MHEEPFIDIVQTIGIIAAFLSVAYCVVAFRRALEKLLKGQQRLNTRLDGLETMGGGIKSDIADDIAEVRRLAAFLRSSREANDNDTTRPREGNGGGK